MGFREARRYKLHILHTSLRHPLIQSERRLSSSLAGMPFSRMYTGTPSVDAYEIALYKLGGYTGSAKHAAALSAPCNITASHLAAL